LIEEKARGLAPYPEEEELDEPEKVTDQAVVQELLENFKVSGYAEREPATLPSGEAMIELPFTMRHGDKLVRGRIDAVYTIPGGGVEIVDFKTGSRKPYGSIGDDDQLAVYAAALRANGLVDSGAEVKLTYLFLDGEPPLTRVLT
jgi:RecB family exonuclease